MFTWRSGSKKYHYSTLTGTLCGKSKINQQLAAMQVETGLTAPEGRTLCRGCKGAGEAIQAKRLKRAEVRKLAACASPQF